MSVYTQQKLHHPLPLTLQNSPGFSTDSISSKTLDICQCKVTRQCHTSACIRLQTIMRHNRHPLALLIEVVLHPETFQFLVRVPACHPWTSYCPFIKYWWDINVFRAQFTYTYCELDVLGCYRDYQTRPVLQNLSFRAWEKVKITFVLLNSCTEKPSRHRQEVDEVRVE